MTTKQLKAGFSAVEVLIVVVVLVVAGLLGWTLYNNYGKKDAATPTASTTTTEKTTMPEVNKTSDLQTAENAVNSIDVDKSVDTTVVDESLE